MRFMARGSRPENEYRDLRFAELDAQIAAPGPSRAPEPSSGKEAPAAAPSDFYGDENLLDVLTETASLSLPEVKEAVFASLLNHAGGELLHDDCTLMIVEVRKARG